MKGDKPAEVIRKIFMIICLLVCIASAVYVLDWVGQSLLARWRQDNLSDQYHSISDISERFKMLQKINPDTVGWLTVPGTKCDNPVVKTTDNDKYLHTSFEGKESKYGTLFADEKCKFEGPTAPGGLSANTIVYGHHMKDGAMMGELKKLRDYSFYRKHPVIQFTTIHDKETVDWKIVSIFIDDANDEDFNIRQPEFTNEHGFNIYLNEIRQRSMIDTGIDVRYGDHLLTLSTCTYEFKTARLVVVARRVREGETSKVDVSKTKKNLDAVYPKAYFKKGTLGRTVVTPYTDLNSLNSFDAITSNLPAYSETERPTMSSEEESSQESKPESPTDR
ncbi:MAG: class B sortase, partial [Clostridia bacterium]|nr:class B sortase [Clostridia bacterium]